VIQRFAGSTVTVATRSCTVVNDTGVIKLCGTKRRGAVADAAILVGLNVIDRIDFARGQYPVMAGLAVIHDTGVIKRRGYKARGLVTLNAITVGGYVVLRFAGRGVAVMTLRTITGYTLVIEGGAGKAFRVVAQAAIFIVV
jgi:hypothetical protein